MRKSRHSIRIRAFLITAPLALGHHNVGKTASSRNSYQSVRVTRIFVRNVFDEQQDEDVVSFPRNFVFHE